MGITITVFQVDFKQLALIPGSKDATLLDRLSSTGGDALASEELDGTGDEDDGPPAVTYDEALRRIIAGDLEGVAGANAYSEVLATIYDEFGHHLGDINVALWGVSAFFKGVDDALKTEGFGELMSDLAFGGPPLDLPLGEEPAMGFLTPETVSKLRLTLSKTDWSRYDSGIRETIEDLGRWIDRAAKDGHGLVGVVE